MFGARFSNFVTFFLSVRVRKKAEKFKRKPRQQTQTTVDEYDSVFSNETEEPVRRGKPTGQYGNLTACLTSGKMAFLLTQPFLANI